MIMGIAVVKSTVAGLIMAAVVLFSHRCHINPDNVATPIAASLGDITTLALLSTIASVLYMAIGEYLGLFEDCSYTWYIWTHNSLALVLTMNSTKISFSRQ